MNIYRGKFIPFHTFGDYLFVNHCHICTPWPPFYLLSWTSCYLLDISIWKSQHSVEFQCPTHQLFQPLSLIPSYPFPWLGKSSSSKLPEVETSESSLFLPWFVLFQHKSYGFIIYLLNLLNSIVHKHKKVLLIYFFNHCFLSLVKTSILNDIWKRFRFLELLHQYCSGFSFSRTLLPLWLSSMAALC